MAQGDYATINGLDIYYQIHGAGKPLLLIHGALGTTGMFDQLVPSLGGMQIIAVELQGHGHTADIDRPLSFEQMADDLFELARHLGLGPIDILGYSLGGGVALQTVIRHPQVVRKLVAVSAPCRSEGWYPAVLTGMRAMTAEIAKSWVGSPMHQAYASVAPRPEDWPQLVAKLSNLLAKDYDWSTEIAQLRTPVMIVVGDADAVRTAHAVEFFELLGGGKGDAGWDGSGMSNAQLAILPATTHYNIMSSPALATAVTSFLKFE